MAKWYGKRQGHHDADQPLHAKQQQGSAGRQCCQRADFYGLCPGGGLEDPARGAAQQDREGDENGQAVIADADQRDSAGEEDGQQEQSDRGTCEYVHCGFSFHYFDELQGGLAHRTHEGQAGKADQGGDAFRGEFQQARGAGLLRRFIDHPEEDHAHLEEPEDARQLRGEVARDGHAAIDQDAAKPGDIHVTDFEGLAAERR